ncbi:MAG: hypothetical protein II922_01850, partial [Succinimonas sp.]|nr:hypothetical protein [Succinimonas sp.]
KKRNRKVADQREKKILNHEKDVPIRVSPEVATRKIKTKNSQFLGSLREKESLTLAPPPEPSPD